MDKRRYIIAIDLGTTSIRTLAYDTTSNEIFNIARKKIKQYYPQPGWVEQDAAEIVTSVISCLERTISDIPEDMIYGLGVTNQRETIVAFDPKTGKPYAPAIVWQCRRTHEYCEKLRKDRRISDMIHKKTGLFPESYFSATKCAWLLENNKAVAKGRAKNRLYFGTLETYVVYCLTNGKSFVTDHTNACRTLLYNLKLQDWDSELCQFFGVPQECLATVVNCDEYVGDCVIKGKHLKIGGIIGDQQSSLFGQNCVEVGSIKTTYGTGAFMLANIGNTPVFNQKLITTVAWKTKAGINYALEGNMYTAGACMNWLQDSLHLIESPKESEAVAASVENTGGVFFVPALAGLGAPFWKGNARAKFEGITLSTTSAHMVRAVLRGIVYNTRAVFDCMQDTFPISQKQMKVDGGMSNNGLMMQFQSDILHFPVAVSEETESTSLGACYMCGLCFGAFKSIDDLSKLCATIKMYRPTAHDVNRESNYQKWLEIVDKC